MIRRSLQKIGSISHDPWRQAVSIGTPYNSTQVRWRKFDFSAPKHAPLYKKSVIVEVNNVMTADELAKTLEKPIDQIQKCLDTINGFNRKVKPQTKLGSKAIQEICRLSGFGYRIKRKADDDIDKLKNDDIERRPPPDPSICKPKPPVVTIMGHVDHGKTTLLDYLRKSSIVEQEFGGITQHIGAFSVPMKNGKSITFLDTPGHAAFSAMRGRGAMVTNVIVLVIAADDGVMPQTEECISHARTHDVPLIVALNKIDKAPENVSIIKDSLVEYNVVLEEYGGDTQCIEISALKGLNIDALQDAILTQAEMMGLEADYGGPVEGHVIESKTKRGLGKAASILIQRGTLKKGALIIADLCQLKVKGMLDEHGKPVKEATPGMVVEVFGWKDQPAAGDLVLQAEKESQLKAALQYRKQMAQIKTDEEAWKKISADREEHTKVYKEALKIKQTIQHKHWKKYGKSTRLLLDEHIYQPIRDNQVIDGAPELKLILKVDVDGSLEAIIGCLQSYSDPICKLNIIESSVGQPTASDIELAATFDAVIIAFNIAIPDNINALSVEQRVDVRPHNIIYKLINDVKEMLNNLIPSEIRDRLLGEAVVQKPFEVTEKIDEIKTRVPVAGSRCINGTLHKNKIFKLVRDNQVLYRGPLYSLRHFKQEVADIESGMECGICLKDFGLQVMEGDTIFCVEEYAFQPEIEWQLPF